MRLLRSMICVLAAVICIQIWHDHAEATDRAAQRELFVQAEEALRKGQRQTYQHLLSLLDGYPLLPYLLGNDLENRLDTGLDREVRAFLKTHDETPPADSLRRKWLMELGGQCRWNDYIQDYRPQSDENLQCLHGQALMAVGKMQRAMDQAETLWLSGTSRPKSCDPLFEFWIANGGMTRELAWQRIDLAMTAGQARLARYLGRFLSAADQQELDFWLRVDEQPGLVLERDWSAFDHDSKVLVLAHGLRKLTRVDASETAADWDRLKLRHGLDHQQFAAVENDIALFMSLRFEEGALSRIAALPHYLRGDRLREWSVRAALRRQDWSQVLQMLDSLTTTQKQEPRWQYWRARALEQRGWAEQALHLYQGLAGEGHYFGMLAADRLGHAYVVHHVPLEVSPRELERIRQDPGLQRAVELFALNRHGPARVEWQQAQRRLGPDALRAAARWAQELGWHDRAITASASAKHVSDLTLRFPLPYADTIMAQSIAKDLNPAWVYGVMRQESLFMADVGSSAGALGLMQIMPQTGKRIAGWHGEKLSSSWLLLQPERNIRYGTTYLRRQLDDLQNHHALATAAYNAGQHRVKGWLPPTEDFPADIWVETIPFNETRNYVERVLSYTAIYEHRLGRTPTRLSARLAPIQPLDGATRVAERN